MTSIAVGRYCSLPPGSITAISGQEFRSLLRAARVVAGLGGGQLAVRSGIPRSSVYSLGSSRKGLPQDRDQVARYLAACRLDPAQVVEILQLWGELHGNGA